MNFEPYNEAVIHLAWYRDHRDNHLLFSMVELRPAEFPPATPCSRKEARARGAAKKRYQFLHYRRFVLSIDDAVKWVRNMACGHATMPDDPDVRLIVGEFVQEPPWPHFLITSTAECLPFAPDWTRGARAHFLFPREQVSPAIRSTLRGEDNRARLLEWLNFDLVGTFDDYQGAICVVAPNPIFRAIEKSHRRTDSDSPAEAVAYRLITRQGQSSAGCRLEVMNERLRGRMNPMTYEFDDVPITELQHPIALYKEGISVSHPLHGMLRWREPGVLARVINLRSEVVRRTKHVSVPGRGRRRPPYNYDVEEVGDGRVSSVGENLDDSGVLARLVDAEIRRKQATESHDENWFHETPAEAAEWVRQKIGGAYETVFIVDPYFAGTELFAFAHAIRRPEVRLRILTSVSAFESKRAAAEMLADLHATSHGFSELPDIRILTGRPSVHDRFLVVDDRVWLSGNSLNTLGERAGMIVGLHNPGAVLRRLEVFWQGAVSLADWLSVESSPAGAHNDE